MKKFILIVIAIIAFIFIISDNDNKEMRLRVIAHSNSQLDQDIKMKVVNALAKETIDLTKLDIIKEKTEYTLQINHCYYQVKIRIETQKFPTKYYGNQIIKGGTYKTLVVIIGEGNGNNYWSILYPEYFGVCFDDIETGNVEYKSWFEQWFNK